MSINGKIYQDNNRKRSRHGSINSQRRSICSSRASADNESLMELTDEHVLRLLDRAIDQYDDTSSMNSRRYLPQVPSHSTTMSTNNHFQLSSRSAIEDLFQVFENNPEFITMGKRLLNKKRKLEQLRAQLNLPETLTNEDTAKLSQIRERLRAKRKLPTVFIEPEKSSFNPQFALLGRKSSTSMPDLAQIALNDSTNQSSSFDLNATLNSSIYRKRRRKSLFRSTSNLTKQVGPEFVVKSDSKTEKITVPSRNPSECICHVIILLPNNSPVQVSCKPDATVRIIHETIVSYIDLIEHDLFGLTFLIDGEYYFPSMDMKLSKLINDAKWKTGHARFAMQLKIKYFVNDISVLRHFLTQHFFYLQFRQMILADTFQLTNEEKLSFALLAFQAEYGDSTDNDQSQTYFVVQHYASGDLIEQFGSQDLRQEIIERHRFYNDLNDVQAERMFVENVMKLDDYGYHIYKLYKETKYDEYFVGIRLRNISTWPLNNRQRQTKSIYDWDQIERLVFDKRTFSIVLKLQTNETKIKYLTNNSKKGKYLFDLCYDTYTYAKSLLLRHNSRYSLLNEPISEVEFIRRGSDADSLDQNLDYSRSHENLTALGKNSPLVTVYDVDLYKDSNNSLGMSLMGDITSGIFIKSVFPMDGSAARSGKIQTGDRLLSYNGKNINGMTVQEIADILSVVPNPCRLKLSRDTTAVGNRRNNPQRPLSADANSLQHQKNTKHSTNAIITPSSNEHFSNRSFVKGVLSNESITSHASDLQSARDIKSAVFPVTIDKTGHDTLGFLVVGGLDSEVEDHGIYVKHITPGGAASKSELLMEGDKILEVNGTSLTGVKHSEAVELFRRATKPKCHLLIERLILTNKTRSSSTSNTYPFARPENTFEVILNRDENGLGLSLSGGVHEYKPIEIVNIYPNQPAALSGQLKIGDVVLAINDAVMYNRNVQDVTMIIGKLTRNIKFLVCRPDHREYQAYLEHLKYGRHQSTTSEVMNNTQTQVSNEFTRDLPPKSPGNRRHMPAIPTKTKRGEDQSTLSEATQPSPVLPTKTTKSEIFNVPVQYEKIQIILPKAPQGTYGLGLSQIDPQQSRGGIFICALQPKGVAEKDGRLHIDDRLLCINDQNTDQMTYRDVVDALKATTKKGVSLLIARPITDSIPSNGTNIISEKEISTKHKNIPAPTSAFIPSIIEKIIPREKPKLLPLSSDEKPQPSSTILSPDSIEASASPPSSAAPVTKTNTSQPGSALRALLGKKMKPIPPTKLEITPDKNEPIEAKNINSPTSNTDLDEDSSDIKTPAMSPRSPVAPVPTVLELKVPTKPAKPLSASQTNDIANRTQYYQQSVSNETLVLNAGVTEKVENLTTQLITKISTPAITMETGTLMDECTEIETKINSQEYLEEFRALKTINEHEPTELNSVAIKSANQSLNRFQNLIPYDFNRVILSTKPDYINASHLAMPIGDKSMKYIICPPPVPESTNAFWQMIVDQRVKCIVGIFNEQDLKKMKCPIYWPETVKETMTLSPSLSLTLLKYRQLNDEMEIKEILVHVSEQKQEHSIIFLTYTKWPIDDKVPNNTQSFLNLVHLAHSYQTSDTPLLIHCNTGVGRTGCTLLVSLLLIKIIRGRTLDIYAMAKECRRQRSGVIQTEQQYRFVYECARDALNMAIEHSIMQSAQ